MLNQTPNIFQNLRRTLRSHLILCETTYLCCGLVQVDAVHQMRLLLGLRGVNGQRYLIGRHQRLLFDVGQSVRLFLQGGRRHGGPRRRGLVAHLQRRR